MEIEAQEIILDDRLQYLTLISQNQEANKPSFAWGVAFVFLCIGVGIGLAIMSYAKDKSSEESITEDKISK